MNHCHRMETHLRFIRIICVMCEWKAQTLRYRYMNRITSGTFSHYNFVYTCGIQHMPATHWWIKHDINVPLYRFYSVLYLAFTFNIA